MFAVNVQDRVGWLSRLLLPYPERLFFLQALDNLLLLADDMLKM